MLPIVIAALVLVALWWIASGIADVRARQEADRSAAQMAASHAGLLASEMQKFRLLPAVLIEYPEARDALLSPAGPAARAFNLKLEVLAQRTDAAVIYLIGEDGITVSASNWRSPGSFVGQNFGFRPYFRGAMESDQAELFALGSISRRPGMFIARRVTDGDRSLGVIVVKVEFDRLEREWSRQPGITFVINRHGVVIVTSRTDWRFHSTVPLTPRVRAQIASAFQFGDLPLPLLALDRKANGDIEIGRMPTRVAKVESAIESSSLYYLEPLGPALAAARSSARAVMLGAGLIAVLVVAFLLWSRVRRVARNHAWRALEAEVATRTSELSESNAQLVDESRQRRLADEHLHHAREELARANRLSSLGQITAGVAHEINQPVASIRTIAENAQQHLERGNLPKVTKALGNVIGMADRIGSITAELRGFASRGRPDLSNLPVDTAITGSLLMLADRFRSGSVKLIRRGDTKGLHAIAERVRLEQVVVNLLQNALDAVEGIAAPAIAIDVSASETQVDIRIEDNGNGIGSALADDIFTPFVSTKSTGLGLGLGIARDLTREFGGSLDLGKSTLGGAAFTIRLKRAG